MATFARTISYQWRSDGGAGVRAAPGGMLGAAKGRKMPKIKKIPVKIQIVSFICVCVQGKKALRPACTYRQLGSLAASGSNRLSSFKNLRRKGGKFDHRPGRPKVLLRHCFLFLWLLNSLTFPGYEKSGHPRYISGSVNLSGERIDLATDAVCVYECSKN